MKIAFISYWSCPLERLGVLASGGMNVYVLNLAIELGKKGHKVDIFTRTHGKSHQTAVSVGKNVRIIHLPSGGNDHYKNSGSFADDIVSFINKNGISYEIIHAHYYYSGIIAAIVKNRLNIPFVMTFHTLGLMKMKYARITDQKRIKAEKTITKECDFIISSTEFERRDLENSYSANRTKIAVISPGVNHNIFKPYDSAKSRLKLDLPADKKIILFVGRIDPVKGLEFLIEAIYKLTQTYPGFQNNYQVLLIGGDIKDKEFWKNREVKKIKKLIYRKNLDCCIKFLGSKPQYILPYYYSAADVVVMPSVYESFGLVVLEAMASGSAILASEVGGLKYLISDGKNGRLFESGSPQSLGDVMLQMLNDRNDSGKLRKNAVLSSYNFCWNIQADLILKLYNKAL
jgi:D-inositol-3-phosphate glycosyltransferase